MVQINNIFTINWNVHLSFGKRKKESHVVGCQCAHLLNKFLVRIQTKHTQRVKQLSSSLICDFCILENFRRGWKMTESWTISCQINKCAWFPTSFCTLKSVSIDLFRQKISKKARESESIFYILEVCVFFSQWFEIALTQSLSLVFLVLSILIFVEIKRIKKKYTDRSFARTSINWYFCCCCCCLWHALTNFSVFQIKWKHLAIPTKANHLRSLTFFFLCRTIEYFWMFLSNKYASSSSIPAIVLD